MNRLSGILYPAGLVAAFLLLLACVPGCDSDDNGGDGPLPRKIAVYKGRGAWDTSAVAVYKCLEHGGRDAGYLTEQDIQSSLADYGMLIIGGGDPLTIASALGFTGRERIRELVETGGAYIGLGAGAALASDSIVHRGSASLEGGIGLFEGLAKGPIQSISTLPSYVLTLVEIPMEPLNPEGRNALMVLYYGGPQLTVDQPANAVSAGTFSNIATHAGFLFEYGYGRVVIVSVQPEIEENDERDGSTFGSDLTDPESDWPWLLHMVEWGFRERL